MTPTTATPVAKSLHTLTVLQQVANIFPADQAEDALDRAMRVLGLAGRPDPYGLRARALALLIAGKANT
jgi:hypothetical protein